MTTRAADVVVLGLGPAGASAAAAAAARGCRVIAVDRKREPGRPVQCAEFVPMLVGLDATAVAGAVRQPIGAMATFVEHDAPDLQPNFPGHMLDRAAFDAALVERAAAAGASIRFGARVRRLNPDGAVELADGSMLRAAVVIGADGPRSLAGAAIGRINAELVETRQVTVPLERPAQATDIFLSAAIPGGYGWLFPKGRQANLGAGVDPAHKARLKSIVAALHARLAAEGRVGAGATALTGGAIPVGGMLRPWGRLQRTLVLLCGDASGLANPVTGAGIAAAVHSGKLAGGAAADRDPAAYEEELDDVYRAALERAVRRRGELANSNRDPAALRRSWIAYPEYWQ
ncbi:MAG TPA: NAD(P)/FAD-dependent oxidoreductase [Burkholderiaceae bacterium]|nr:NAD(P)/FAD-dependent oxidoreductase [Burkholderiaceae bacterium]